MTRILFFLLFIVGWLSPLAGAGNDRAMIRKGNKHFGEGNFQEAELEYRRSLEENPLNPKAMFNLGNALYRQGRYDEAADLFDAVTRMEAGDIDLAGAYHNLGNAHLGAQRLREGIEAYKNALRIRPEDNDTRHNLEFALKHLQDPPPEDQPQSGEDQQQDGEQEQGQDRDAEADPDPDGQEHQDQQESQADPDGRPQQQPGQISPQDAERILDALNQQEQKVQENVKREEKGVQPARTEREW
jgi:Ca-activated chloride channel homolog